MGEMGEKMHMKKPFKIGQHTPKSAPSKKRDRREILEKKRIQLSKLVAQSNYPMCGIQLA